MLRIYKLHAVVNSTHCYLVKSFSPDGLSKRMAVRNSEKNQGYDTLAKGQKKADADIPMKNDEEAIYEDVNPYTLQS